MKCGLGKEIQLIGVHLIEVEMLQLLSYLVNELHRWAQLESKKCFNYIKESEVRISTFTTVYVFG